MTNVLIDTERFSKALRARSIDANRRFLITRIDGSLQEDDLTEPVNLSGFGRVRHFLRRTTRPWPQNPLPIDPAARALNLPSVDAMTAEVLQNSSCNWRCWYCYVPFDRLSADSSVSEWFSAEQLVQLYAADPTRPVILALSGGQPDLIPEWIPDTMRALRSHGLSDSTYLWSDDNLSTDYFWRFLGPTDIAEVQAYRNYGRVACFKGFDSASFSYNTHASETRFDDQFLLFRRLAALKIDLYAYVTLTGPDLEGTKGAVRRFVDRLQDIADFLPLRTIPLEIRSYQVVTARLSGPIPQVALDVQQSAIEAWNHELDRRFTSEERSMSIVDVPRA